MSTYKLYKLKNDFLEKQAEMITVKAAETKDPLVRRKLTAKASFLRAKAESYKSSSSRQKDKSSFYT